MASDNSAKNLGRYIKNSKGEKVEQKTTSVNLEMRHHEFLKRRNLNLSLIIREHLDALMAEDAKTQTDIDEG